MSFAASIAPELSGVPSMSKLVHVALDAMETSADRSRRLCSELESGNILFFPRTPFAFLQEDREFLLGLKQANTTLHKNIAYRPAEDRVTGFEKASGPELDRLRGIVRNYSHHAANFLADLLPPYRGCWKLDYASFRPLEERGRPARPARAQRSPSR